MAETEFAPGIPFPTKITEKIRPSKNDIWEYSLQYHEAKRAGPHYDLRLGDPVKGGAYSWALRRIPEPGDRPALAIPQPIHSIEYQNFEGTLPPGYGEGKVTLVDRDQAHILSSSADKIRFNLYKGKEVQEFTLIKTPKGWLLINQTDTRKDIPDLPDYKPKFKEIDISKVDPYVDDPNYVMFRKDDGIHVLYYIKDNGNLKLFSPKVSVSKTELVDHTYKVPQLMNLKIPGLKNSIFRGELILMDKTKGKAAPIQDIVAFANANTWNAYNVLDKYEPKTTIFDVVQYKGKNMENLPYGDKLELIHDIVEKHNLPVEIPTYAISGDKKRMLLEEIKRGKIPETKEGVVFQNLIQYQNPIKAKFIKEYDVYIRNILPGKGSLRGIGAGGFEYSFEPNGPILGAVGSGFSIQERIDMWKHPEDYIGKVAKVKAIEQYPTGALRIPVFISFHYEKSP